MECCRICLASNGLTNIFEIEETASNIAAIACVDISQDDGLPQYICLLCKHELDISINFKDKCETTYEMLKEQHAKEIEVKESIILNLLSGGNAMDNKLPETTRKSILNTVINSVKNDGQNVVVDDVYVSSDNETLLIGEEEEEEALSCEENNLNYQEVTREREMESVTSFKEHTPTRMDTDDQMTDITESEFEIPELLNVKNQDLSCEKCNFYFSNKRCLLDHIQRIHRKTMEQCQICMVYFPNGQILRDHLRKKHDVSDDNKNVVFMCKACDKSFRFQSELNGHRCSRSGRNEFWCELCQSSERSNYCRRNHKKNYSDRSDTESQVELLCSKCNACFLSHEELKKHIVICCTRKHFSEKENPFKCTTCDKSFAQAANLTAHQRTHKFIKSHVCSICQMEFYKQNSLEKHLLQHDNYIKCTREETYLQCEVEVE